MSVLSQLVLKDLRCLLRRKEVLVATFGFALLLVVVSCFSFRQIGYGQGELKDLTAGIIWITFVFCGVLGLTQSFVFERENNALVGLLQAGIKPESIFLAKFFSNLLFLFALQVLVIITHGLLFGAEIFLLVPQLMLISFLTAIGFTSLGTLLAAISTTTAAREILLPLLLFPLSIPLLAGAVFVSRELLRSGQLDIKEFWFVLICAFDVIAFSLSWALFEYVVKE